MLTYMYCEGLGVAKNYARALELFQQGHDAGFAASTDQLAYMYLEGVGVASGLDWTTTHVFRGACRNMKKQTLHDKSDQRFSHYIFFYGTCLPATGCEYQVAR